MSCHVKKINGINIFIEIIDTLYVCTVSIVCKHNIQKHIMTYVSLFMSLYNIVTQWDERKSNTKPDKNDKWHCYSGCHTLIFLKKTQHSRDIYQKLVPVKKKLANHYSMKNRCTL